MCFLGEKLVLWFVKLLAGISQNRVGRKKAGPQPIFPFLLSHPLPFPSSPTKNNFKRDHFILNHTGCLNATIYESARQRDCAERQTHHKQLAVADDAVPELLESLGVV